MNRLGLIGGASFTRSSGVYSMTEAMARERAKSSASNYVYNGVSNALTSAGAGTGFCFSPDGLTAYVATGGGISTAKITQWTLTAPFDLSTISYAGKQFLPYNETNIQSVAISNNGTRLFWAGNGRDTIWSATLSTPFDLSTAANDQKGFYTGDRSTTGPFNAFFGNSGTKVFFLGGTNVVYQYTLSTAWDSNTASYDNKIFSANSQDTAMRGLFFKSDGTKMYLVGQTNDTVYQYSLSTAWDISTASYDSVSFSVSAQETAPFSLFFKGDGTKMYVMGQAGDDVNEYNLSTAWDISSSSFVRASATVGEGSPTGMFFKGDGTKMYVVGSSGDAVRQFSLSTAWDVSTISFEKSFLVTLGGENAPAGVFFKDDGTEMYISGDATDRIYQYSLSTAWDIGSASHFQGAKNYIGGLQVSSDGTLVYASDALGIYKYTLSTAYDISSASATPTQTLSLSSPFGFWVGQNGKVIYCAFQDISTRFPGGSCVARIDLSTPHDLNTASVGTIALPLRGWIGAASDPWCVQCRPDLGRLFVMTNTAQGLYQFDLRF